MHFRRSTDGRLQLPIKVLYDNEVWAAIKCAPAPHSTLPEAPWKTLHFISPNFIFFIIGVVLLAMQHDSLWGFFFIYLSHLLYYHAKSVWISIYRMVSKRYRTFVAINASFTCLIRAIFFLVVQLIAWLMLCTLRMISNNVIIQADSNNKFTNAIFFNPLSIWTALFRT